MVDLTKSGGGEGRSPRLFGSLARFVVRFRWLVVAVWLVAVIVGSRALPSLSSVASSNNAEFLSSSSPSERAAGLARPFQGSVSARSLVIVSGYQAIIVASRGSGPLTAADEAAFVRAEQTARGVSGVSQVRDGGVSPDRRAREAVVTVAPTVAGSDSGAKALVDGIRASFDRVGAPAGLTFHLTGQVAENVDAPSVHSGAITYVTALFVVVVLFLVYRALLAPVITLIPAVVSLLLASGLIAEAAKGGLQASDVAQQLLIVLLLGAGTDYGLFLAFRIREEVVAGREPREALVAALSRVGEVISYSAGTVAAALLTLLLASFAIYRGLGGALAIGVVVLLAASLTLTPALFAIFGRAAFWPSHPKPGAQRLGLWGRVAERVIRRPRLTLAAGVVLFAALAAGVIGYRTTGLTSGAAAGSDSAIGKQVLAAHFTQANVGSDQLLMRFERSVWEDPSVLATAQRGLAGYSVFRSIIGPLGQGVGSVSATELAALHAELRGGAGSPPASVPRAAYQAYRQSLRFISPDGLTIQYYVALRAGVVGTTAAAGAIPQAQTALGTVARAVGAQASGVAGQDAVAHDIQSASNSSIVVITPVILLLILVLLGLLLRSLIAPWYLVLTIGLSYLASLGFAMLVFVHLGGDQGLIFVLPLLMLVFSMALGEDYNILVMSRIREEAWSRSSLPEAITHAIGITGSTVTSAGLILAGTFAVLGLAGGSMQARQLGFSIAFSVALDTFFVRTLLVPSIAILLGRWNWWPATLSRQTPPEDAASPVIERTTGVR